MHCGTANALPISVLPACFILKYRAPYAELFCGIRGAVFQEILIHLLQNSHLISADFRKNHKENKLVDSSILNIGIRIARIRIPCRKQLTAGILCLCLQTTDIRPHFCRRPFLQPTFSLNFCMALLSSEFTFSISAPSSRIFCSKHS